MFILEISTFMVNQGCVLLNTQLFMPTIYCNIVKNSYKMNIFADTFAVGEQVLFAYFPCIIFELLSEVYNYVYHF